MKNIKILLLMMLLLGFFSVTAQQRTTELQKQVAEPATEQTDPGQYAADQPPAGQPAGDETVSVLTDQTSSSMAETEGPAADKEGFNQGVAATVTDETTATETDSGNYSGLAADQDPNEITPIDK